jgi:hypothetical protein
LPRRKHRCVGTFIIPTLVPGFHLIAVEPDWRYASPTTSGGKSAIKPSDHQKVQNRQHVKRSSEKSDELVVLNTRFNANLVYGQKSRVCRRFAPSD